MGIKYVRAAFTVASDKITTSDRMVLLAIAANVMDEGTRGRPAGVYWGGHELLCALTNRYPDATGLRLVRRHLTHLTDAGLVGVVRSSSAGRRAVYRLTFPPDPGDTAAHDAPT